MYWNIKNIVYLSTDTASAEFQFNYTDDESGMN